MLELVLFLHDGDCAAGCPRAGRGERVHCAAHIAEDICGGPAHAVAHVPGDARAPQAAFIETPSSSTRALRVARILEEDCGVETVGEADAGDVDALLACVRPCG